MLMIADEINISRLQ